MQHSNVAGSNGVTLPSPPPDRPQLQRFIHLKLMSLGLPGVESQSDSGLSHLVQGLLSNYRQKSRLLADYRSPVDTRIEDFLNSHTAHLKLKEPLRLPAETFNLDRPGVARELSLPMDGDTHESELLSSYRIRNGVLHNPRSDRRTTAGTFHVAEGGLPIPADKVAVPLPVFVNLFRHAVNPPRDSLILPYTANQPHKAASVVSLLIRPTVVPEIPGVQGPKAMEVRFFVPGSLVSNLDFVESIFGNAGDPVLPENDAALEPTAWTGHTGCVILAPHLTSLTKKELGLPHVDQATDRQRRDGACWKDPSEKYNNGTAFKLTCRTAQGVIVTLIADNYYGYCKKEVKTQISFSANLYGSAEEEHAGGAIAFPSFSLGDVYQPNPRYGNGRSFGDVVRDYGHAMAVHDGYGVDRTYPNIIYINEHAILDARSLLAHWHDDKDGTEKSMPFLIDHIYVTPWGQKLSLNKHPGSGRFRVTITVAEGVFCHKPCTVSGGGKSEISKSLGDYMIYGPIYVANLQKDLDAVEAVLHKDHSKRWKHGKEPQDYSKTPSRPILSADRTLGSVIKLLTPTSDYTDEYNRWLAGVPSDILALVFLIKRLYRPEWGDAWREHFTVDIVNGEDGHELKVDNKKAGGTYLRVGLLHNHGWRTYKLRQDFFPAAKIQTEDDISASVVVPPSMLPSVTTASVNSFKLVTNTETRLFQRPDDAIIPGFDKQTEHDLAQPNNFISNFQPLPADEVKHIVDKVTEFDAYTPPMRQLLADAAKDGKGLVVSSAHPRIVDGKPTKNPRYLQDRPDLVNPLLTYLSEMGTRFWRSIPADHPLPRPVDAVLVGRRNNPPDKEAGIRPLAVYNPIHYQDLPELFMDFVCSLTGKSPSTTGAGSEGALTKAPFNAVSPVVDLNAALVSYILTGLGGFSTAAGYVGPDIRVDHDISLLVPEIWCRLKPQERDPKFMIERGLLERINDFDYDGRTIPASRLGYRITYLFVRSFFGRLFDNPAKVFDDAMLRPETQGMDSYVDGILNIVEAQERVAKTYFEDGSVEHAIPPLKAVLHIMAHGRFEGKDAHHPDIRRLFTREHLLESDWYRARLAAKQASDVAMWKRHVAYLESFVNQQTSTEVVKRLELPSRLEKAKAELKRVSDSTYLHRLTGTLGLDPTVAPK